MLDDTASVDPSRRIATAVLALAAVVLAGCGTRVDHDRVVAAAEGRSLTGGTGTSGVASDGGTTGSGAGDASTTDGGTVGTAGAASTAGSTTGATGGTGSTGAAGTTSGTAGAAGTGSDGSTGATSGGQQDTTPVKIGTVGTISGIAGGAQKPGPDGFGVWVKWVNSRGGVNGRPIRHFVRDDAGDTARHSSAVKEMIESVGVVALVAQWSSQTQHASADYILRKRIPVVGGDRTGDNSWTKNPMFFPEAVSKNKSLEAIAVALSRTAGPAKKRLGILVCAEAANVCALGARVVAAYAPKVGLEVVYNQQASFAQPTYTSECLNMRSANVEVAVLIMPASATRKIASDCAQQSVRPIWYLGNGTSDADFNKYPYFDRAAVGSPVYFLTGGSASNPLVREFRTAFDRFLPGVTPNLAHMAGWVEGKLFESVLKRVQGQVTNESLLAALWTVRNETLGGLTIPLTFPRMKPVDPPRCLFPGTIRNGAWVVLNDGKYICHP